MALPCGGIRALVGFPGPNIFGPAKTWFQILQFLGLIVATTRRHDVVFGSRGSKTLVQCSSLADIRRHGSFTENKFVYNLS